MEDKREQCKSCKMECPESIFQAKLNKGRIPFDKCLDFMKKQTNADRIRAMSDEELAQYLSELIRDTYEHEYCDSEDDWLIWLQREAEE